MKLASRSPWAELETAVDVWHLSLHNISASALEKCFSLLSPQERVTCETFVDERARCQYLSARALCRATLSRYVDIDPRLWSFTVGAHGKPRIASPVQFASLHFNVSHANGLTICGVSRAGQLGIDVEKTSNQLDVERLSRQFLSVRERERLKNVPSKQRVARFFEQWVVKEAYLKGTGRGITGVIQQVSVDFSKSGTPLPIKNWLFFLRWLDSAHVAAAAIRKNRTLARVSVRWLKVHGLP